MADQRVFRDVGIGCLLPPLREIPTLVIMNCEMFLPFAAGPAHDLPLDRVGKLSSGKLALVGGHSGEHVVVVGRRQARSSLVLAFGRRR